MVYFFRIVRVVFMVLSCLKCDDMLVVNIIFMIKVCKLLKKLFIMLIWKLEVDRYGIC